MKITRAKFVVYLDLCTVDFIDLYRIMNIKSKKLSQTVHGILRDYIITVDKIVQEQGVFVPEVYKIKEGYRLTYRHDRRYFSMIFKEGSNFVDFVKSNSTVTKVSRRFQAMEFEIIKSVRFIEGLQDA